MAALNKLTDNKVRASKPRLRSNPTHDRDLVSEQAISDGGGLYLLIRWNVDSASVSKLWSFFFRSPTSGKQARMGLGSYPSISLATAREQAAKHRQLLACGCDPREVRSAERNRQTQEQKARAATFGRLAEEWLDSAASKTWGEGHAKRQRGMLNNHILPSLRNRPIASVSESDVAQIVQRIAKRILHAMAGRVRGIVREVFAYAVGTGDLSARENSMAPDINLGNIKAHVKNHFAALVDPADLAVFLRAAKEY